MSGNESEWNDLATVDPLWAILSDPEKRCSKWDVDEFFATGEKEIEGVLHEANLLGHPAARGTALDFGCGVGRVTRALANRFSECYALDISEKMINLAKQFNEGARNCHFIVNVSDDLAIFPTNHFDMIYANIVLQHLPHREKIRTYIREFVRVLVPGGLIVFQVASWIPVRNRIQLRRRLYVLLRDMGVHATFLYEKLGLHPMRMNFIREREVVSLLEARGGRVLEVRRTGHGRRTVQSCLYFVSK